MMDGADARDREDDGMSPRGMPLHRRIQFWLFAGLVALAAVFYLWWGLAFGVWVDNGVYAVAIVLLLFGLAGMWLSMPNPPVAAPRN